MTTIEFRTGLPDKHAYLCKLLRVAWRKGQSVVVLAPEIELPALDASLWQFDPASFLPHSVLPNEPTHEAPVATAPVLFCSAFTPQIMTMQIQTLVHLGSAVPAGFESFDRMIELIGLDAVDVQQGRERWKHYKTRAYPLEVIAYKAA